MEKEKEIQEEVKTEEVLPVEEKLVEESQEAVAEEVPNEPAKPVYDTEELQTIENERVAFLQEYRGKNRVKSIMFFVVMFLMLGTFIIIPNFSSGKEWGLPVMISIAAVLLAFVLTYSYLTRKKMTQRMRDYFSVFYTNLNKFVFGSKSFDKVLFENPGKIEDHLFLDSLLYKDILEVRSRGATTFEFEKKPILVCDCAGSVEDYKRVKPVYVGKYLVTGNKYKLALYLHIYCQ